MKLRLIHLSISLCRPVAVAIASPGCSSSTGEPP